MGGLRRLRRLLVSCLRGLGSFRWEGGKSPFFSFFRCIMRMEIMGDKTLKRYTGFVKCCKRYTLTFHTILSFFKTYTTKRLKG